MSQVNRVMEYLISTGNTLTFIWPLHYFVSKVSSTFPHKSLSLEDKTSLINIFNQKNQIQPIYFKTL